MTLLRNLRRRGGRLWPATALVAGLVAAVLAACGGSTTQVEPFVPGRVISFGDENSVLLAPVGANGRKYTVNGVDSAGLLDCTVLPIWVQTVASTYGFVYEECNPTGRTPAAFNRAVPGAKVEDPIGGLQSQIEYQRAHGGFASTDIVTLLIGGNDIIELYQRVARREITFDQAMLQAEHLGTVVALASNAIMAIGPRLLVSTVPDMSRTPFAIKANRLDPNAISQLSQLNYQFNAYLRTRIDPTKYDGRNYGLILGDDMINALANSPSSYGLTNTSDGVCVVELPNCNDVAGDLRPGAVTLNYLWADDQHMSPYAQGRLGQMAQSRALQNPF